MEKNPLYPTIIPLCCPVTHDEWGAPGSISFAGRLYMMNNRTYLSPTKPYSEFIISSYDPHDALIATAPPVTLRDHVQTQVIEVDPSIVQFFAHLHKDGIPYVVKAVSAKIPLGIRVHPDETGSKRVSVLGDVNIVRPLPKSLMIFAESTTHVLSGFHSAAKIVAQLLRVPEFADAIGREHTDQFVHVVKSATPTAKHVRHIVATLLAQNPDTIAHCLRSAVDRLAQMPSDAVTDDDRLLIALANIFPNDPMCFVAYLFPRHTLNTGDALFIPSTEPYCILNGNFIEISTKSDAVFFAGLTTAEQVQAGQFLQTVSFNDSTSEVRLSISPHK